jgi:site-specific recombinase XerD
METISSDMILSFLDNREKEHGNLPQTRNQRLAAIKTFYRYLALQEPTLTETCRRVCSIHAKKTEHKVIEPLTEDEIKAILNAVPSDTLWHQRDHALILLMYNTGARVQELADLKISDLKTDKAPQVKLKGKGGKERVIPLWHETSEALQKWMRARDILKISGINLFTNTQRRKISRFGIAHILNKYTVAAAVKCPSLQDKKVTPHTIRHTTALYLIQSNVDIVTIKYWLGHADIRTTGLYIEINIEMKRKALEQCPPPGVKRDEPMLWHQQKTMVLLQAIRSGCYVE